MTGPRTDDPGSRPTTDDPGSRPTTDDPGSRPPNGSKLALLALLALVVLGGCVATIGGEKRAETPFENVASETGFQYQTTGDSAGNSDGGVFGTDYDRDGWPDLLVVGGDEPVLFENTGGEFERANVLPETDVKRLKSAMFFDYDNDGWEDLLLIPAESELVFFENTGGEFERRDVGLSRDLSWADGAAAADYDGDGCLDVFVIQNGNWERTTPKRSSSPASFRDDDTGNPNLLFRGHCGEAPFENVTAEANITGTRWSLATSFTDLTGDGRPDIHVANDFNYDRIYVNQGDGTFVGHDVPNTNRHGMASDVTDVNGDGRLDIFVTNIEWRDTTGIWELRSGLDVKNRGNNLLINRGNGTFEDRATEYGMRVTDGWGWAGHLFDFDNDGDRDLIHTTKYYLRTTPEELYHPERPRPTIFERVGPRNFTARNSTDLGFEPSDGRGMALVDFDRDGALEFAIADTSDRFKLYQNNVADGGWLRVRIRGTAEQTPVGARVHVTTTNGTKFDVMNSQTNFFSQDPRWLHFGLGTESVQRVRAVFPDGTERTYEDVPTNSSVVFHYNGSSETLDGS